MIIMIMTIKMMLMITANYFISKNINNMIYDINLKMKINYDNTKKSGLSLHTPTKNNILDN